MLSVELGLVNVGMQCKVIGQKVLRIGPDTSADDVLFGRIMRFGQDRIVGHFPRLLVNVKVELGSVPAIGADVLLRSVHGVGVLFVLDGSKVGKRIEPTIDEHNFVTNG